MANLETIQKDLESFGLTSKQAQIYLLLVVHKELRIQEITNLSHIPRSSVYENLRNLQALGIVEETVDDNFKRVRAYPLSAIRHNLDEELEYLQQRLNRLEKLEAEIGELAPDTTEPANIRYYKGKAGARQVFWNTLKAHDAVYVYSEWGRQKYVGMQFYERFAAENRHRNLKEKVLINLTPSTLASIKRYTLPGSPAVRTKVEDMRVLDPKIMQIKGETMMYNSIYAQVYLKHVEIHGFEIESSNFAGTQRSIFNALWQTATPLRDLL